MDTIDRREFLKRSALVGAAAVVTSPFTWADVAWAGSGCQWAASCLPRGGQASQREATEALEAKVGRKFGAAHFRMAWGSPLVNDYTTWSVASGHVPMLSWFTRKKTGGMVGWASIARGEHDRWIRQQAKSLKATGWRGFFAFHKEPENEGKAGDWKAAHKRVRDIFDNVGVTGWKWLVTLTASTYQGKNGGAAAWLPERYNLLGVDGYNRGRCADNGWRSFPEIFGDARAFATSRGKNLYVQEIGCVESAVAGKKAAWLDEARATIKGWPEIKGFSYNHESTGCTYWADSSTSALNSFKAMGQDPYFA